jgi:excisionase family DNA binding protein
LSREHVSKQALSLMEITGAVPASPRQKAHLAALPRLFVNVEEAGAILNVGRSTAYNMKKRGELPCVKVGGKTLVSVAALQAMAAQTAGRTN